ncbi:hypothetical protein AMTR_s00022p00078830 [Amborella trichopoda]|uniref:Uncharacterized protein n=1 Tax=Amborella trichopoda TaxID=13333 RepID=W1PUS6_AMBTC|nr:hypothetical protein AMTR_s00022p00078830 [Amborella trichopoda]
MCTSSVGGGGRIGSVLATGLLQCAASSVGGGGRIGVGHRVVGRNVQQVALAAVAGSVRFGVGRRVVGSNVRGCWQRRDSRGGETTRSILEI